jgi:hypothetical protein
MWLNDWVSFLECRSRRSAGVPTGSRRSEMLCRVGTARLCQASNRMECQLVSDRRWKVAIALTSGTAAGVSVTRQRGKSGFGVGLLDDNVGLSTERMDRRIRKGERTSVGLSTRSKSVRGRTDRWTSPRGKGPELSGWSRVPAQPSPSLYECEVRLAITDCRTRD